MPCSTIRIPQQTPEERAREIEAALSELRQGLSNGSIGLVVGSNGAIAFTNWEANRNGVTDVCAFHALTVAGSFELAQALSMAEMTAGRKADMNVIGSGVHSHDGGRTWGSH